MKCDICGKEAGGLACRKFESLGWDRVKELCKSCLYEKYEEVYRQRSLSDYTKTEMMLTDHIGNALFFVRPHTNLTCMDADGLNWHRWYLAYDEEDGVRSFFVLKEWGVKYPEYWFYVDHLPEQIPEQYESKTDIRDRHYTNLHHHPIAEYKIDFLDRLANKKEDVPDYMTKFKTLNTPDPFNVLGEIGTFGWSADMRQKLNNIKEKTGYHPNFIMDTVMDWIKDWKRNSFVKDSEFTLKNIGLYGSILKDKPSDDVDVVVEYEGEYREDSLYNAWHGKNQQTITGEGKVYDVDINPIKADRTGTMEEFMETHDVYLYLKR